MHVWKGGKNTYHFFKNCKKKKIYKLNTFVYVAKPRSFTVSEKTTKIEN